METLTMEAEVNTLDEIAKAENMLPEECTISEWFSGSLDNDYKNMVKNEPLCYNEYAIYVRYSDGIC